MIENTKLLTTAQVAEILNLSPRTLEALRIRNGGPRYVKLGVGRAVRYQPEDVAAFIQAALRNNTSDPGRAR